MTKKVPQQLDIKRFLGIARGKDDKVNTTKTLTKFRNLSID